MVRSEFEKINCLHLKGKRTGRVETSYRMSSGPRDLGNGD